MIEDIYSLFQKPKNPRDFDAIRIKLASPEKNKRMVIRRSKKSQKRLITEHLSQNLRGFFVLKFLVR